MNVILFVVDGGIKGADANAVRLFAVVRQRLYHCPSPIQSS